MADPNMGQLLASTWNRVVSDKPEDQIFKDVWLFNRRTTKNGGLVKVDGGAQIEVPLEYAVNSTFKSYSDMEALDVYKVDVFDAAEYDWKEHAGTIVTSWIEIFKNSGKAMKFDILEAKIQNAIKSAKDDINEMLFADGTGNSSKDWHGLQQLVPDVATTGTVGGINRATFTWSRTNQITDGGASFSTLPSSARTASPSPARMRPGRSSGRLRLTEAAPHLYYTGSVAGFASGSPGSPACAGPTCVGQVHLGKQPL